MQGLNLSQIVESLAHKLKQHRDLYAVQAICFAKVPIVKFIHRPTNLEGDISLYNTLVSRLFDYHQT